MSTKNKIVDLPQLISKVQEWKANDDKVVFTNGCFDILHLGHVDYLEKTAQQGQRLVIGLNSSASVSRLKGPTRPINDEYARGRVLAALGFVDAVIVFDEDTPLELIQSIVPSVLVKGGDYDPDETDKHAKKYMVGSDVVRANGGSVTVIDIVDGYSTTSTIEKMKKS